MSVEIIHGDARDLPLDDDSVDLIVTSPPYWSLRSYQDGGVHYDGQIGAEATPTEYVDAMIDCTREWMRVLKPTGSIFINLGDKYGPDKSLLGLPWEYALRARRELSLILRSEIIWHKPSSLPESVTDRVVRRHEHWFHLTLRPRYYSAVDEIREPHSPATLDRNRHDRAGSYSRDCVDTATALERRSVNRAGPANPLGKLPGSVWEVATQPLRVPEELGVSHWAAFPLEWPMRLIRGWSPPGICTSCGEGRSPVPTGAGMNLARPQARRAQELAEAAGLSEQHQAALLATGMKGHRYCDATMTGVNAEETARLADEARAVLGSYAMEYAKVSPTGLAWVCACPEPTAPTRPATVLDPFGGTGTTALAADVLGRHGIHVDASADYNKLAEWRTTDPGERARAMGVPKPKPELEGQSSLLDHLEPS